MQKEKKTRTLNDQCVARAQNKEKKTKFDEYRQLYALRKIHTQKKPMKLMKKNRPAQ